MIRIISTFFVIVSIILISCAPQASDPVGTIGAMPTVSGLSAVYIDSTSSVRLSWQASAAPNTFRIFRTSQVDADGNPTNFTSSGSQLAVPGTQNQFTDIVGLVDGLYYYLVCPVNAASADQNVIGTASNTIPCWVGKTFTININDGDIFITIDTCDIVLNDRDLQINDSRFTDSIQLVINATTKDTTRIPVFTSKAPLSFSASSDGTQKRFRWNLKKGDGSKIVYAEVLLKNGVKDTLFDDIQIQPYRIEFKLRNELDSSKREMVVFTDSLQEAVSEQRAKLDQYKIFKPWIDFSVSVYNDSTLAKDFEYYILFPDTNGGFFPKKGWISSRKITKSLTDYGARHNDQFVYRFNFSPDSAAIDPASDAALNLSGIFKENGTLVELQDKSFKGVYNAITKLNSVDLLNRGIKEFSIVAKFKGRFFDDTRIVYSSGRFNPNARYVSYIDFYPPVVIRDLWDFQLYKIWEDGDQISGPFSIQFANNSAFGGVWDRGGAYIKKVDLVIAAMPDSLASKWPSQQQTTKPVYPVVTLANLMNMRHTIFSYETMEKKYKLTPFSWNNLDLSDWPSGWYLFAYVTEDEFGNRGIASLSNTKAQYKWPMPNPYHIYIVTKQKEL